MTAGVRNLSELEEVTNREGDDAIKFAAAVIAELDNPEEVYEWSTR